MASVPALKRADSIAETMPDALRQSRYYMKKVFARLLPSSTPKIISFHVLNYTYFLLTNLVGYELKGSLGMGRGY